MNQIMTMSAFGAVISVFLVSAWAFLSSKQFRQQPIRVRREIPHRKRVR
jgi:hypothetical protein